MSGATEHASAESVGKGIIADKISKAENQTDIEGEIGTNPDNDRKVGGIAADRLRSIVERIERLEEEKKALGNDVKDIYAEAKSAGFDTKVLRQLIKIRAQEPADVEEMESLLDVYRHALGM